jgi:predicted Zn-dependent protease with MMP-like domain
MLLLRIQSGEEKRSSVERNEKEADEYSREPGLDEHSQNTPDSRSRYVFATMSFLMALLFFSGYLNTNFDPASGWLLLLGVFAFGAVGVLFLWPKSIFNRAGNGRGHEQDDAAPNDFETEDDSLKADAEGGEDSEKGELSSFERLIEEALAALPDEFQERMENVFVRVQDEPGKEVLGRVGIKKGYTLLGLYEGVPLTAYGHDRAPQPEIITIYQRAIELYCHGDPDRMREQVRHTVLHELAHHFGIDHEEMPIWIR